MNEFHVWLTVGDTSSLLDRQSPVSVTSQPHGYTVNVYRNDTRQIIDGFGASINNDGAYVIYHSPHRHEIMQELFGSGENDIGKIDYFKTECYHRQTYKHTVRQTEGPTDGRTDRQKTDIAQCKVADKYWFTLTFNLYTTYQNVLYCITILYTLFFVGLYH